MVTTKNRGIVIQSQLPHTGRLIIIDNALGKIDARISGKLQHHRLVHGACIEYSYNKERDVFWIHDIELLMLPASWVMTPIGFFHHLIELMRFFIMYHNPQKELMEHLQHLYVAHEPHTLLFFQLSYLSRFFLLIGICPEESHDLSISLFRLISAPIDIMLNVRDDMLVSRQLSEWLQKCLLLHPDAHRMQTKHFIDMDTHDE
jgi:hypothetical protein